MRYPKIIWISALKPCLSWKKPMQQKMSGFCAHTYICLAYKIDNSEYQCIHSYYDMFLFYVKIQILFGTALIQTYWKINSKTENYSWIWCQTQKMSYFSVQYTVLVLNILKQRKIWLWCMTSGIYCTVQYCMYCILYPAYCTVCTVLYRYKIVCSAVWNLSCTEL